MIVYYAIGGGLGHLTRAQAVIHSLGLGEELTLLSASPHCGDPRVTGGARHVRVPVALASNLDIYRGWLIEVLEALSPRLLFIDAFPCGLLGEFCDFPFPSGLQVYHVARLLRWSAYRPRLCGAPPFFEMTFCVEELTATHRSFLSQCSSDVVDLELSDPPSAFTASAAHQLVARRERGAPLWMVLHSGPQREVDRLCEMAQRQARAEESPPPQLIVVSPNKPTLPGRDGFTHVTLYPAAPLFPQADRLFTACGFNTMRQAALLGERHQFLPFDRPLDDQHLRAARHRASPLLS